MNEQSEVFKQSVEGTPKSLTVVERMKQLYGHENVEISKNGACCTTILEHDQIVEVHFDRSSIDDPIEDQELIDLRIIHKFSDDEILRLRKEHYLTPLFANDVYLTQTSKIVVDGVDIINTLDKEGVVIRWQNILLNFNDLENSAEMRGIDVNKHPITPRSTSKLIGNQWWDYDYPALNRTKGDLLFRPVLSEVDLHSILHELGHALNPVDDIKFPLISKMSKVAMAELRGSTEDLTSDKFDAAQSQFAKRIMLSERQANQQVLEMCENSGITSKLFPGKDGLIRLVEMIAKQELGYATHYE